MDPALCEQQAEAAAAALRTQQEIAAALGVKTGDQLPPPKRGPGAKQIAEPDHEAVVERWSKVKKACFRVLEPGALILVAQAGPSSHTVYDRWEQPTSQIGHNRGVWPVRLVRSGTWRDTSAQTWDRSPHEALRMVPTWRIWAASLEARDRLAEAVETLLTRLGEDWGGLVSMRAGWYDVGPTMDMALLEAEVHALAGRLGIRTRDDAALSGWLDRIEAAVQAAAGPGQITDALIERVIAKALGAGRG